MGIRNVHTFRGNRLLYWRISYRSIKLSRFYEARPQVKSSFGTGGEVTLFQSEVYPIMQCEFDNLRRRFLDRHVTIFSDSQMELKSSSPTGSILSCFHVPKELRTKNFLKLNMVPGHAGIAGNDMVDKLAREASIKEESRYSLPFAISYSIFKETMRRRNETERARMWKSYIDQYLCRTVLPRSSSRITAETISLRQARIKVSIGLITGHCWLRHRPGRIGVYHDDISCSKRLMEDHRTISTSTSSSTAKPTPIRDSKTVN